MLMSIKQINEPVAGNIERIIREKGLKKCVVALKAGLTGQELSDVLNGRRIIKVNEVPRVAKALDVSLSELFALEMEAV